MLTDYSEVDSKQAEHSGNSRNNAQHGKANARYEIGIVRSNRTQETIVFNQISNCFLEFANLVRYENRGHFGKVCP